MIPRHTCASAAALRKQMSVSEAAVSATILPTSRCSPRSDGSNSRLRMSLIFLFRQAEAPRRVIKIRRFCQKHPCLRPIRGILLPCRDAP
jgi:hypothetical protein